MIIQVFEELKTLIRVSSLPLPYIGHRSGVNVYTIRSWLKGQTHCPRIDTMVRVASVLGKHIELTGNVGKMVRFYEPKFPPRPDQPRGRVIGVNFH